MASTNALSKANINFSLAMLRQLSEDDRTANIFFSPFSISSALAMVLLGARGDTATQMAEVQLTFFKSFWSWKPKLWNVPDINSVCVTLFVFCLQCLKMQDCQEEVHTLFQQLLEELNKSSSGFLLSVANRLYGEQSFLFLQVSISWNSDMFYWTPDSESLETQ